MKKSIPLLVIPTSTGESNDDFGFHDNATRKKLAGRRAFGDRLQAVVLSPVFHRPRSSWRIYTHALDRDSLSTDNIELGRLDLQLIGMIEKTKRILASMGFSLMDKSMLWGFSAAGMFSNRFAVLHPERVRAVATGSPGGWPIAPVMSRDGEDLRYPVGVKDLEQLVGRPFQSEELSGVPQFFYLGEKDENDSVIFEDGYDAMDRDLILKLFGTKPLDRWPIAKGFYTDALKCKNREFKVYPGVEHTHTQEIIEDVLRFLKSHL